MKNYKVKAKLCLRFSCVLILLMGTLLPSVEAVAQANVEQKSTSHSKVIEKPEASKTNDSENSNRGGCY